MARSLRQELKAGPAAGLNAFLALWRKVVVDTDFHAGCPALAVAMEEPPADSGRACSLTHYGNTEPTPSRPRRSPH